MEYIRALLEKLWLLAREKLRRLSEHALRRAWLNLGEYAYMFLRLLAVP